MKRNSLSQARAKQLRTNMTPAETRLWLALRAHRLNGVKFVRQLPIGPYIADFAARRSRLIVEVDGETHAQANVRDAARTAFLAARGFHVIRFANADVMANLDGVLQAILAALEAPPLPTLPPRGEG
jgi:very-short-patch-repair endonuclease